MRYCHYLPRLFYKIFLKISFTTTTTTTNVCFTWTRCRISRNTYKFVSLRNPHLSSWLFLLSANLPMSVCYSVLHLDFYVVNKGWLQIHSLCLMPISVTGWPSWLNKPLKPSVYLAKSGWIFLTFLYWFFHLVQGINWGTIGCISWRRQWYPTPVLLLGKSRGWRSLVGCSPWSLLRVRHDWSDLAAAAAGCISNYIDYTLGFTGGSDSKECTCNMGDLGSIPGLGSSLEKRMATLSIILAGEFHGQRSLAGYSPWGHKELDTTAVNTHRLHRNPPGGSLDAFCHP